MLQAIKNGIYRMLGSVFRSYTHGDNLEQYILSKNPQSVYDVEHLTTQYERKVSKGWII